MLEFDTVVLRSVLFIQYFVFLVSMYSNEINKQYRKTCSAFFCEFKRHDRLHLLILYDHMSRKNRVGIECILEAT
jgi:hypothetical protein